MEGQMFRWSVKPYHPAEDLEIYPVLPGRCWH